MDFVRFTGEWFIYYVLIALGGGVLMGLTAAIFEPAGVDVDRGRRVGAAVRSSCCRGRRGGARPTGARVRSRRRVRRVRRVRGDGSEHGHL